MNISLLLVVPESLDISETDQDGNYTVGNDVIAHLVELNTLYYPIIVPQTHAVAGKKLAHAVIDTGANDPLTLVEAMILTYGLDWSVVACQPFSGALDEDDNSIVPLPVQAEALIYLDDRYTYDENGNVTGTLTKDKSWIHQWAGQDKWH